MQPHDLAVQTVAACLMHMQYEHNTDVEAKRMHWLSHLWHAGIFATCLRNAPELACSMHLVASWQVNCGATIKLPSAIASESAQITGKKQIT